MEHGSARPLTSPLNSVQDPGTSPDLQKKAFAPDSLGPAEGKTLLEKEEAPACAGGSEESLCACPTCEPHCFHLLRETDV